MQTAPNILKSAFLEPMGTSLASQLSLDLFARADKDFMQMFAGLATLHTPPMCRSPRTFASMAFTGSAFLVSSCYNSDWWAVMSH